MVLWDKTANRFISVVRFLHERINLRTARDDRIAEVFELYDHTIKALAEKQDIERTLRDFELSLPGLFGYARLWINMMRARLFCLISAIFVSLKLCRKK